MPPIAPPLPLAGPVAPWPLTLAAEALSIEQISVFLLAFAVLLGTARVFGELARRLGQPVVLGEILAGVVLGATVLGSPSLAGPDGANVRLYDWLFPVYVLDGDREPVTIVRVADNAAGDPDVHFQEAESRTSSDEPGAGGEAVAATAGPGERVAGGAGAGEAEAAGDAEAEPVAPGSLAKVDSTETRPDDSAPLPVDEQKSFDGGYLAMTMFLQLSAVFLLLVAGLEVDLSIVWRQGRAALFISVMSMVVPFALGAALAWFAPGWLGFDVGSGKLLPFALFVGVAMSITALPVIAKILLDLNLFRTDVGMLIMASAMVNDLLGWIGFAIVLAMVAVPAAGIASSAGAGAAGVDAGGTLASAMPVLQTVGLTLAFVGLMLTLGRWLIHRSLPFVQAHSAWPGGVLSYVLCITLVSAAATEAIGIHAIFGAFIAGVAIGDSSHLRRQTRQHVEQFISNIFAPLFFASIGLRVNFVEGFDPLMVVLVLVIAIAGKLIGCYFGAVWAGMGRRDATAIGMGMTARGAMEIILAQIALNQGLIGEQLFVAIVIMAIATSLIAGPAMQAVLGRRAERKLVDLLSDKLYAPDLGATDAAAAIGELSGRAAGVSGLPAADIARAVRRRERLMPTGLAGGLAIPHARLAGLKKPLVAVGRSRHGVDFDASDGGRARLIFLLLSPKDDPDAQVDLLRSVATAFRQAGTLPAALAASSFTEFKAALATVDAEPHELPAAGDGGGGEDGGEPAAGAGATAANEAEVLAAAEAQEDDDRDAGPGGRPRTLPS